MFLHYSVELRYEQYGDILFLVISYKQMLLEKRQLKM